jgi:hypothetical protein
VNDSLVDLTIFQKQVSDVQLNDGIGVIIPFRRSKHGPGFIAFALRQKGVGENETKRGVGLDRKTFAQQAFRLGRAALSEAYFRELVKGAHLIPVELEHPLEAGGCLRELSLAFAGEGESIVSFDASVVSCESPAENLLGAKIVLPLQADVAERHVGDHDIGVVLEKRAQ